MYDNACPKQIQNVSHDNKRSVHKQTQKRHAASQLHLQTGRLRQTPRRYQARWTELHPAPGNGRSPNSRTRAKTWRHLRLLPEPGKADARQGGTWGNISTHALARVEITRELGREDHTECTLRPTKALTRDTSGQAAGDPRPHHICMHQTKETWDNNANE